MGLIQEYVIAGQSFIVSHSLEEKRVGRKYPNYCHFPETEGSDEVQHCQDNDNYSRQINIIYPE